MWSTLSAKMTKQENRSTVLEKDIENLKEFKESANHRLMDIETKDQEQDNRLTELESNGQTQEQLYNVSTHTLVHDFSNESQTFYIEVKEK